MMDNSSIITQVNRDEEALDIPPYSGADKGLQSVIKKPRNRNIFSSFFCCFGAHANAPHSTSNGGQCTSSSGESTPPQSSQQSYESDGNKNKCLLAPVGEQDVNKKCIVIDLDETLVHSSFKPVSNPDFIVPVEIDGTIHQVYVLKRPHVDEFLKRMGELFECVLFTASLAKYADPVSDLLDKYGTFRCRLFRDSCVFHRGNYVKDLSKLGRDIEKVIIVDNSPASYSFHPDNAVPVASWFDDMSDRELLDLIPLLEEINNVDNVVEYMKNLNRNPLRQNIQNGNIS